MDISTFSLTVVRSNSVRSLPDSLHVLCSESSVPPPGLVHCFVLYLASGVWPYISVCIHPLPSVTLACMTVYCSAQFWTQFCMHGISVRYRPILTIDRATILSLLHCIAHGLRLAYSPIQWITLHRAVQKWVYLQCECTSDNTT